MIDPESATVFENAIAAVLAGIASGEVMSYGEVAAEAGRPGAARAVGAFLKRHDGYPWWRVVAANGRLVPGLEAEHARLLAGEGIALRNGRVAMR